MGKMRFCTRLVLTFACLGLLLPDGSLRAATPSKRQATSFSLVLQNGVQDVVLSADRSLTGIVVDVDGRPRAGVNVLVESSGKAARHAVTDSQGRFSVSELHGGMVQIATAQGAALCRVWSPGTAPPTAHSRAILVEMPDVVRSQFYGPTSQLLSNPWVLAAILTTAITITALVADRDSGS